MSGEAEYWTFPTNPDEFDQDERISFSRLDNKHIAVQDDGTEYEFDTDLKRWIPMIDEDLIREQQKGYFASGADNDDSSSQKGRKRNRSDEREVSCARMQLQLPPRTPHAVHTHNLFPKCSRVRFRVGSGEGTHD
jgi:hypothetical protein